MTLCDCGAGMDWLAHLPWDLLGHQAAPKEDSGLSSAEAIFGQPLLLPSELVACEEAPLFKFQDKLASSSHTATCRLKCTLM
jgi:hypothetical protein